MSMSAKDFNEIYGDLPDGAFFALAEEMGIDAIEFTDIDSERVTDPDDFEEYNQNEADDYDDELEPDYDLYDDYEED